MANLLQIEKYLKEKKIPYKLISLRSSPAKRDAGLKVIDLGGKVYTVRGVTDAGVILDDVVKTLVVRTPQYLSSRLQVLSPSTSLRVNSHGSRSDKTGQANSGFVALAIRGEDRVDFKKVRDLFGAKSELARPEEVLKVCHVPVGAVCPILLSIPLYFDRKVMNLKHVNMGSGDLTKGLEMDFGDLIAAIGRHEIADLTNNP